MSPDKEARYDAALSLVLEQAEDEGLWLLPHGINYLQGGIVIAYLQQELRKLHAVIEGDTAP